MSAPPGPSISSLSPASAAWQGWGDSDEDEYDVDASIYSTPLTKGHPELSAEDHESKPSSAASPSTSSLTQEGEIKAVAEDGALAGDDPIDNMGPTKSPAVDEGVVSDGEDEVDDRQCRICFAGVEEEDGLGRLISPCLCTGSMRYVHVKCINAWRGTGTNAKAFMECPQCHHQYHLRRTLVSGLATSRPLLLILSTFLFTLLTLFAGSILHYLLLNSSRTRRRLLTTSTIFDSLSGDGSFDDGSDGTIVIIGGGGAIIYDIVIAAIQTFTSLAISFADLTNDLAEKLPGPIGEIIFHVGVRFILGIAVLGSISFLSLLLSMSLFGPLHLFNSFRGIGMFRNWGRRRQGANGAGGERGGGAGQIMIILFVVIGTINTLWTVYTGLRGVTRRLLIYVEAQILEVNPDDRNKERERRRKRREEWWGRRWVREGRWKRWSGWWELVVRVGLWVKGRAKAKWEGMKERWMRQMEVPLD